MGVVGLEEGKNGIDPRHRYPGTTSLLILINFNVNGIN